jgi:hypothetical protein
LDPARIPVDLPSDVDPSCWENALIIQESGGSFNVLLAGRDLLVYRQGRVTGLGHVGEAVLEIGSRVELETLGPVAAPLVPQVMVRYYGLHSNAHRGAMSKRGQAMSA